MSLCPTCNDSEIIIAKDHPFYIESISDYAEKNKKNTERDNKTIEELKKELDMKDKYIRKIIKFLQNDKRVKLTS